MPSVQQTVRQHDRDSLLSALGSIGFDLAIRVPSQLRPDFQERSTNAMFRITRETLRRFSLREILLIAAMNLQTSGSASEIRVRPAIGAALSS
jgi:hypothetical protein